MRQEAVKELKRCMRARLTATVYRNVSRGLKPSYCGLNELYVAMRLFTFDFVSRDPGVDGANDFITQLLQHRACAVGRTSV
jgi:hypothetical protein